jgi:hypothetical protein
LFAVASRPLPLWNVSVELRTFDLIVIGNLEPVVQLLVVIGYDLLSVLRSFERTLAPVAGVAMGKPFHPRRSRFCRSFRRTGATGTEENGETKNESLSAGKSS